MVTTLEIKNFKSIKHLSLNCKRLNIFIGEPNAGKSNILESLGMLSWLRYSGLRDNVRKFVRFELTRNLFFDEILDDSIEIKLDDHIWLEMRFKDGRPEGNFRSEQETLVSLAGDHTSLDYSGGNSGRLAPIKFYRFETKEEFRSRESDFLLPPSGDNLLALLQAKRELRSLANDLLSPTGLKLRLSPHENKIELDKQYEDIAVASPYQLASDTMQRMLFHLAAIVTNKDSILIFEEPEAHAFPYYVKYLAELIALDRNSNQYFIATHNPYFLMPLIEKSPQDEIAIFITYLKDYETKVKPLNRKEMQEITEIDVFSNVERYIPTK